MLEDPATPTFLGMTGNEWEALYGGIRSGFRIWERNHTKKSDIEKMDIPEALKKEYLDEYSYFIFGEDAPEFIALITVVGYLALHGQVDALIKAAISILLAGVPIL